MSPTTGVRVMTYNIHGGHRLRSLAAVVRQVGPDVMVVNESPKTPWVWRWLCDRVADAFGLRLVCGGRPAGSNLICAGGRVSVVSTRVCRLGQPRLSPRRGIASAQLRVDGVDLGLVGCHLSLIAHNRAREVDSVLAVAEPLTGTTVVAGDLNEEPDRPVWGRLGRAGFTDVGSAADLTFPSRQPVKRIDAIFVRDDARVVAGGVHGVDTGLLARASDHRPVVADLEIGPAVASA